jgi:predicted nucleotidyltransferase
MRAQARKNRGKPDPAILADIVSRIVEVAKPEQIVLFGSAARGTMGPNSDYDLLVIKKGKFDHHRVAAAIYRNMSGEAAVDVVVATPEEVVSYRDSYCLVFYPAMREGRVVYAAKTPAARRSARVVAPRPLRP